MFSQSVVLMRRVRYKVCLVQDVHLVCLRDVALARREVRLLLTVSMLAARWEPILPRPGPPDLSSLVVQMIKSNRIHRRVSPHLHPSPPPSPIHTHSHRRATMSCAVLPLPRKRLTVQWHSFSNPIRFDFNSITGLLGEQSRDPLNELYLEIPLGLKKSLKSIIWMGKRG